MGKIGLEAVLALVFGGVVGLGILVGPLLWRHVLSPRARMRRSLRRLSPTRIAKVQDGQIARIVGTLRLAPGQAPVEAPITGRLCAYWEASVSHDVRSGSPYRKIAAEDRDFCSSIRIEDPTGHAIVELAWPQVIATNETRRDTLHSGYPDDRLRADERCRAFLSRNHHASEQLMATFNLRYSERVLQEGAVVTVVGLCHREPDPDARSSGSGYRERPLRLRITAPEPEGPLISDDPTFT